MTKVEEGFHSATGYLGIQVEKITGDPIQFPSQWGDVGCYTANIIGTIPGSPEEVVLKRMSFLPGEVNEQVAKHIIRLRNVNATS